MKKLTAAANAGLILCLVIALYVGFRLPNRWSVNYYIPSVFDGFWRRSLLGTLLYPFGALRFDYHFVAAVQALVLLVLVALLMAHALRSGLRIKLLTMLFLIGPAGGYLFHEVGYVEQLLYLMLLAALAFSDKRLSFVLMALSLFVHEMAAFTVIPIYLASLVVARRTRTAILHGPMLVAVFAVIYLFFQPPIPRISTACCRRSKRMLATPRVPTTTTSSAISSSAPSRRSTSPSPTGIASPLSSRSRS